ncbi:MarR family transcriptional regulator [Photobacterium damselae subsp. damselae]|nr:MarR family transcriptional regulator [Photobacterium damselae]UKA26706.1 MarR family transcriptional regulator [Photobacterium damselae subsp. damselae]
MQICTKNEQINTNLMEAARAVPHQVGLIKLSKTQLKVLRSIERGEQVTPLDIVDRCNLSQSFASSLLRCLCEKSYLSRRAEPNKSGGVTYCYTKLPMPVS